MLGSELSREQWIAHMEVHGWQPITARHACVKRGADRVYISEINGRMRAKHTRDSSDDATAVPGAWDTVPDGYVVQLGYRTLKVTP